MKDALLTIYPTAHKVDDQLKRLSREGSLLGYRITTLPQLTDALWLERLDCRASLGTTGERLVLTEAVSRARVGREVDELSEGLADRMLALIRQLKGAGITASEWTAALASSPSAMRLRLDQFTCIFAAYEQLRDERALADHHDREREALALLLQHEAQATRPRLLEGVTKLLVAEIYDLSLLQFMIVATLIRVVGDADLVIQAERYSVNVARFADLTWNRFVGEESIADQVLPSFSRREGRPGRLGFVLEHVFIGDHPLIPPADDTVTVVEARDPPGEAEAAAQAVRRLIERDGNQIALDRIAILARDLSPYFDYLRAAFKRYRIPLRLAAGPRLRGATPARSLIEILKLPLEGYRREALAAVSSGAFVRCATAHYRELLREVGYIDRATCPLGDCFRRHRSLLQEDADAAEDDYARASAIRKLRTLEDAAEAWSALLDVLAPLEREATVVDHLKNLREILNQLHYDPTADSLTDTAAGAAASLFHTLDGLATEAALATPTRVISPREFLRLIEYVLEESAIEAGLDEVGVRAMSVLAARGLDFDHAIILGLNDGIFPRYSAEDPLIHESELSDLNRALRAIVRRRSDLRSPSAPGPILRSRAARVSEEPFLFFLALSMPTRAITLSYSREDEGGGPLARSPFVEEVLDLLDATPQLVPDGLDGNSIDDLFDERALLNRAAAAPETFDSLVRSSLPPARLESIRRRIAIERHRAAFLELPTREDMFKQRCGGRPKKPDAWPTLDILAPDPAKSRLADFHDGRVGDDPRLRKMLLEAPDGTARRWSASQLSELASCGFRYFTSCILRLDRPEEADHEQTNLETGSLIHDLLKEFFDCKPNFNHADDALALAREVAARWQRVKRRAARDPEFFDLRWASITQMLEEVVRLEVNRRADGDQPSEIRTEHEFAVPLALPATPNGGTEILLQGRIDKLELFANRAGIISRLRVIDYKSSRNRDRLDKLLKPANFATSDLQMAVYLLAAVNLLHDRLAPGVEAEAAYIALRRRDKETESLIVDRALLDPTRNTAPSPSDPLPVAARIASLIEEALDGRFDVDPLNCDQYCPYRSVCRFPERS